MALKRFGVSLDEKVLDNLDEYVKTYKFGNRSQAIRFLVEKYSTECRWKCNHIVAGTIIVIYPQEKTEISNSISEIEYVHHDLILSGDRHFINDRYCMYVASITGKAADLTHLADHFRTLKGIVHANLLISRID